VEERAYLDGSRIPCLKQVHQPAQRAPRVDDVFNQQDVLALELGLGIVQKANMPTRDRRIPVAACHEEVDLKWTIDLPHQVTEKYKAPLQKPEYEELAIRIRRRDILSQLADARRDLLFRVHDSANGPAEQSRISD
jgi:hypothetical protein